MSDFKTEYPVLYFNEYFKRKPMRLNERESEELFTLEETDVNNFEYISLHDHEKEIASLKEQLAVITPLRRILAVTRMANRNNPDIRVTMALNDWDKLTKEIKNESI